VGRWLLNSLPIWLIGPIVILAAVALAVGGLVLFQRSQIRHPDSNWIASGFASVVGGLFGITLGFVVVSLYQDFRNTETAVRIEGADLGQLVRLTGGLPSQVQRSIQRQVGSYVDVVQKQEWRELRDGKPSAAAAADISNLYRTFERYNPSTETQKAFYTQALTKLDDVVAQRRSLLASANESVPVVMQVLLFVAACLTIFALYLYSPHSPRIQIIIVGGAALVVASTLFTATVLDYPFSRALTISNSPLREGVLAHLPR
jgi:hypothetical protein